jgi:phage gp29-like protein
MAKLPPKRSSEPSRRRMASRQGVARTVKERGIVSAEILLTQQVKPHPPLENYRTYFGRSLNLARIESAIINANYGYMRLLTDLARETVSLDGHLSAICQKRFNRVAAARVVVSAASGDDVNEDKAQEYADTVRSQIKRIPDFKQRLTDLAWGDFDGRSAMEIGWLLRGGKIPFAVEDLHWIHPRRLSFGPDRELRVLDGDYQVTNFQAVGFAIDSVKWKFIQSKPRIFNDYPEREGLAPRCLYWSFFGRFGTRERLILVELFGKPWRIAEPDPDVVHHDDDSLDDAAEILDGMGASSTAVLPPGYKLNVVSPGRGAGDVHRETIWDAKMELSKLVLGVTNTTDAQPGQGVGSGQAQVHQDGEDLIVAAQAGRLGETLQQLANAIIEVNYGEGESEWAPTIELQTEEPPDVSKELERLTAATKLFPVSLEEAYQRAGYKRPGQDEAVIYCVQGPGGGGGGLPGAPAAGPAPVIIYPAGDTPEPGELAPKPISNEPEPPPAPAPPLPLAPAEQKVAASLRGLMSMARRGDIISMARQPSTVNGSPEDLIDSGVSRGVAMTGAWADRIVESIGAATEFTEILHRVTQASRRIDLTEFTDLVQHRILHGAMLGALDAAWEAVNDVPIAPPAFALPSELLPAPSFTKKPFEEAIAFFKRKKVLPPADYARLDAAAKRRSFTVAKLANEDLLAATHDELVKQLQAGADLREFTKFAKARLESAGWTPANSSHVELVFRNNVVGSYASGRKVEMTQPAVLAARPYWQIMGVADARQRPTHHAVQNKVMRADDPFWTRAPLPWGHNDRCRAVSRSEADVTRLGLTVITGGDVMALPDPGWDSHGGSLL